MEPRASSASAGGGMNFGPIGSPALIMSRVSPYSADRNRNIAIQGTSSYGIDGYIGFQALTRHHGTCISREALPGPRSRTTAAVSDLGLRPPRASQLPCSVLRLHLWSSVF